MCLREDPVARLGELYDHAGASGRLRCPERATRTSARPAPPRSPVGDLRSWELERLRRSVAVLPAGSREGLSREMALAEGGQGRRVARGSLFRIWSESEVCGLPPGKCQASLRHQPFSPRIVRPTTDSPISHASRSATRSSTSSYCHSASNVGAKQSFETMKLARLLFIVATATSRSPRSVSLACRK
jgi:hypothetical protein